MSCLGEDALLDLVEGRMRPAQVAAMYEHLDACAACRLLVAETAKIMAIDAPAAELGELPEERRPIGRFEILDVLGAGGMGLVYRARDPLLRRTVALKLLRSGGGADRHLITEAQALASLAHPNVVAIFEVGTAEHGVFMAFELVEGESVREWLTGRRSWREILAVFLQAGRGLAAAHEAGIVHGDVKPENILVGRDGRVRVTDFGLASGAALPNSQAAGTPAAIGGTPLYLAPEQLGGEAADARSDQYAFCLSMYEALLRERPFASSGSAQRRDALAGRFRRPGRGLGAPGWLLRALRRGLRVAPDERFPSMTAMLDRLQQSQARSRRSRWLGAAAVGTLLVGAIAVVGAGRLRHDPGRATVAVPFEGPPRFAWAELASADVSASKRFYARLFGWQMHEAVSPTLGLYTTVANPTGSVAGMYQISDAQRAHGVTPNWLSYVAVRDVDTSVAAASRAGAKIVRPPFEVLGTGRLVILRDASGVLVGAWQPIGFNGASARPNSLGSIVWHELIAPADAEAVRFYSAWIGWSLGSSTPGAGAPSRGQSGEPPAASIRRSESTQGGWVLYFAVAECEAVVARARELGATIVSPPRTSGSSGCCAELRDPGGVPFGVLGSASGGR